ncbi:unnamed protein product [Bemisia tabaci]|uniref:Ig-like domain-containing protein n=1 Tax=Bemisia tabaci TaxID=7038 RepID=A0A9P0A050_BEMTA|nr:unnamed protein product [Bemisia tabaci]
MSITRQLLTLGLTIFFLEINSVYTQLEHDLEELNQFRKRLKGQNWKMQAFELGSKFKEILRSSPGLSEAMSIEPYQGSILDYPTPDEDKKLKILELSWNEYYECLKSQHNSIALDKVLPPQAIMVFEGNNVRLTCDICISPADITQTVQWYYSPTMDKSRSTEIDEDSNIVISQWDNTLHILNVKKSNTGLYHCHFKSTLSTVHFLHVVDEEPIKLVRPPTAAKNHSSPPLVKNDITVWNDWSEWSKCSHCGKVGKKMRTGYCMVTLTDNLNIIGDKQVIEENQNTSTSTLSSETENFTQPKNATDSGTTMALKNVTKPSNATEPNFAQPNITDSNHFINKKNTTELITVSRPNDVTESKAPTEPTTFIEPNSTTEPNNVIETSIIKEAENFDGLQLSKKIDEDQRLNREAMHNIGRSNFQDNIRRVFGIHQRQLKTEKAKTKRQFSTKYLKTKHKKCTHSGSHHAKFLRKLRRIFNIKRRDLRNFTTKKQNTGLSFNKTNKNRWEGVDSIFENTLAELEKVFDEEQGSTNYLYKQLIKLNVWNNHKIKNRNGREQKHSSNFLQLWTKSAQANFLKNEDLIMLKLFEGGIPCRSQLLPESIRDMPEVTLRATEVMIAYCKEPCVESVIFQVYDTKGKIIEEVNNTAGLYSTLQELPNFPLTVTRRMITVKANYQNLKITCPAKVAENIPVEWQIKSKPLRPTVIERETKGRVLVDLFDRLLFTSLNDSDANTYSCWQNKELVGVVTLVIDHRLAYEINRTLMIVGVVPVAVTFGICLYRVFKMRNRGHSKISS